MRIAPEVPVVYSFTQLDWKPHQRENFDRINSIALPGGLSYVNQRLDCTAAIVRHVVPCLVVILVSGEADVLLEPGVPILLDLSRSIFLYRRRSALAVGKIVLNVLSLLPLLQRFVFSCWMCFADSCNRSKR